MAHPAALLLFIVATIAVTFTDARSLKDTFFPGDGREAYVNSRIVNMNPSKSSPTSRSAATSEFAETSASSQAAGTHRLYAPSDRRNFATVNLDIENNHKNAGVQPRARSAQDLPRGSVNRSNGNPNMPAMVLGGVSHSQTYEGATATASTDSLALNRGGRGNSFAADMLTSRQSPMRRPGVVTWGVTSQGVRSGALVGATNGLVALAQADQAVAYSHGEQRTKERNWVQGKM